MLQAKAFHFIFILKSVLLDANLELTKHIAADNAFLYSQNSNRLEFLMHIQVIWFSASQTC